MNALLFTMLSACGRHGRCTSKRPGTHYLRHLVITASLLHCLVCLWHDGTKQVWRFTFSNDHDHKCGHLEKMGSIDFGIRINRFANIHASVGSICSFLFGKRAANSIARHLKPEFCPQCPLLRKSESLWVGVFAQNVHLTCYIQTTLNNGKPWWIRKVGKSPVGAARLALRGGGHTKCKAEIAMNSNSVLQLAGMRLRCPATVLCEVNEFSIAYSCLPVKLFH